MVETSFNSSRWPGRHSLLRWPKLLAVAMATGFLFPIGGWLPGRPAAATAEAAAGPWLVPVEAPIVDPFRPPKTRFSAGNRGLEFGTLGGEVVVAVANGVVTFVGQVGGARFVVVSHPNGLRSTYGYLQATVVVRGQRVEGGQRVARAATGFHLTARLGDVYVDPALLFAGAEVVLALVESGLPTTRPASAGLTPNSGDPRAAANHAAGDLRLSAQLVAAAEAADAWYREECTEAGAEVAPAGAGRILVQVAGLGSRPGEGSIGGLDTSLAGYESDDIVGFSYAGGCTPEPFGHLDPSRLSAALEAATSYGPEDTHQDINISAGRLADLIEAIAVERPGQPIDIAAHSLGGIVTRRALEILETRGDVPVSVVVTIASPHQGSDLATAAVAAGGDTTVTDVVDAAATMRDADAVSQVAEAGEHHLDPPDPPPEGVTVVAIAGATDLVVPADAAIWDGASNVIVPTAVSDGAGVHSALPSDPRVARELNLAVAGAAPGCVALAQLLQSVAASRAISSGEDLLSVLLGLSSYVL